MKIKEIVLDHSIAFFPYDFYMVAELKIKRFIACVSCFESCAPGKASFKQI